MAKIHGKGWIEKRGPKHYQVVFEIDGKPIEGADVEEDETDDAGKAKVARGRIKRTVYGTKKEAEKVQKELRYEIEHGLKIDADDMTVRMYADAWQKTREQKGEIRKSTLDIDRRTIARFEHYIGDVSLPSLDAPMLKSCLYSRMREDGISNYAVHVVHMKLKQIMDEAVIDKQILSNPCIGIKEPRPNPSGDRRSLTWKETKRLMTILDGYGDDDACIEGVRIGLDTGMRIGEVMGLTWADVNLEKGSITVRQQYTKWGDVTSTKTKKPRSISISPEVTDHLKKWKSIQASMLLRFWKRQDEFWKRQDGLPVVCDERGGFHNPDNYRRWFQRFCVSNGFGRWTDDDGNEIKPYAGDGNGHDAHGRPYSRSNPKPRKRRHYSGLKFHELRHTQATLMLSNGESIKTVQDRLGHSKSSVTLDMYAESLPEDDRQAVSNLSAKLAAIVLDDDSKVVNL